MASGKHIRRKTLKLMRQPGQWVTEPAKSQYQKKYEGRFKYARAVFTLDLVLIGLAVGLGIVALFLAFFKPSTIADKVIFEATVAPREVVSGASSTLVISWTNLTGEELKEASLYLTYPQHFLLEEVETVDGITEDRLISLGDIPIDGTGFVKVRGVMFGDVGGEQTFRSILTFRHGEENEQAQKVSDHSFSPAASTLALDLQMPERLVTFQEITGQITYKNTGEYDFPSISIEPAWPDGFVLLDSSETLTDGKWTLPSIEAGEEGVMEFTGRLDSDTSEAEFVFHPHFAFGNIHYRQQSLHETLAFIPPPVNTSHSVSRNRFSPGTSSYLTVRVENTSEYPVSDLEVVIDADSPFFSKTSTSSVTYEDGYFVYRDSSNEYLQELQPGESTEVTFSLPLRSSIQTSETDVYSNLEAVTKAGASYVLKDESPGRITTFGSSLTTSITSMLSLESTGRYYAPQGDQLGRGPLPPVVGSQTKYWIFVNVGRTSNALENVTIEGFLASGVEFTGKQTVSLGDPMTYDASTNSISWSSSYLEPTFPPGSKVVGLAFEVAITPNNNQVGTSPTLLTDIRISGQDTVTGDFIGASGQVVTTAIPYDTYAAEYGGIVIDL